MNAPQRGDDTEAWGDVPQLKGLRRLVTGLTATLMLGVLAVAVALVIRIASEPGPAPLSDIGAAAVVLPAGEEILAVGSTAEALTIATRDAAGAERLRLFDPETGAPVGEVAVERR